MNLHDLIKKHEGLRLKPYQDTRNYKSIGYGWNLDAHYLPADIASYFRLYGAITEVMAERLLNISIDGATRQCEGLFEGFKTFTETRRDALIDIVFNMGVGRIVKKFPSFVRAVNAQDWQWAADELKYVDGKKKDKLSDYWKQLGGDPDGTDDGKLERPEEIYRMLVEGHEPL